MSSEICPNIGPAQRRWRLIAGLVMTAGAGLLLVLLVATDAPRTARLTLFVPALAAAILLLQVQERTCIALAARGLQHMDASIEPVRDSATLEAVQRQARRIRTRGVVIAVAVTALGFAIA